jgi:hypothetical protein
VRVSEPEPRNSTDVAPTTFSPVDGRDGDFVPDDRWRIEADDWGGGGDLPVKSTAVCLH